MKLFLDRVSSVVIRWLHLIAMMGLSAAMELHGAAPPPGIVFDLPAGEAAETLKQAALQAHVEIAFPADLVRGVTTPAIRGTYSAVEAMNLMLKNSGLAVVVDERSGAFTIRRLPPPKAKSPVSEGPEKRDGAGSDARARADVAGGYVMDDFVVSGQMLSLRRAIADKRAETVISDAVSADEIGSVPDFGLGEALERLPGVSMITNNGRGEPQFATIRALKSDYNLVMVDGMVLPPTESGTRTVSLDTIPASAARTIRIYKSFTPDLDGNAIGGIVDVRTRSAFDHPGLLVSARAKLGSNENRLNLMRSSPPSEGEVTVSNTFGARKQFGFMLSASEYHRPLSELFTSIESVTFYNSAGAVVNQTSPDVAEATPVPGALRWYAYDNIRNRVSFLGKFEYRGAHGLEVELTAGWFRFNTKTRRMSTRLLSSGTPTITSATSGSFARATGLVANDLFDQTRTIKYATLLATVPAGDGNRLKFSAHHARGDYVSDERIDTYQTSTTASLAYSYRFDRTATPKIRLQNESFYYDPANYRETQKLLQKPEAENRVSSAGVDFSRHAQPDDRGFGVRTGGQFRRNEVSDTLTQLDYRPTSTTLTLAGRLDPHRLVPYNGDGLQMLVVNTDAAQAGFENNRSLYPLISTNAATALLGNDSLREDIGAGYVAGMYQQDRYSMVSGLRFENTSLATTSFTTSTIGGTTSYTPETRRGSYATYLPSATVSFKATSRLLLRAAVSRSLSRASFSSLIAKSVEQTNSDGVSIDEGNSDLKPRTSENLDFSGEWYFSNRSLFAVALFRKNLTNEILKTAATTTESSGGVDTVVTRKTWRNISHARIDGVEFAFTDTELSFLPSFLAGIGLQSNLTLIAMETPDVAMNDGSFRKLPQLLESPKTTFNQSIIYARGKFSARASFKYTGEILYQLDTSSAALDRYTRPGRRYDAQLRYQLSPQWAFTLDGKNLTNAQVNRFFGPNASVRREEGDSGRSYFLGVNYLFR